MNPGTITQIFYELGSTPDIKQMYTNPMKIISRIVDLLLVNIPSFLGICWN